jgi:peptidyl-prolyl cis-trans isomerase D
MSALQFLREKAGVLVAGLIGLSLFIFVISDFFGRGRATRLQMRKQYELGQIAGEHVSYQDYEQRIQNLQEIYKLSGTTNLDEATIESIREQTWEQMVREKILDVQYENLGIGVSTEELNDLVFGNNPHPIVRQLFTDRQTGQFNNSFLVNFLKSTETDETSKKYWLFFENEIVSDRANNKYNTLLTKGLYVTSKQAEFENITSTRTVDFSYIMKSFSSIPDSSVSVTDSEIRDYYSSHKSNYKKTAQRDLEYVEFDITPSAEDTKQAYDYINKLKSEYADSDNPAQFINTNADTRYVGFHQSFENVPDSLRGFAKKEDTKAIYGPYLENGSYKIARLIDVSDRPDSVHARHILIQPKANLTLQQAKAMADSLARLIKKGIPFQLLAQTNSDDQGSAQTGGDLGWFKEGQMVVPFNNACFSAKKNEVEVIESSFGYHIIEVLDLSKKVRKYDIGVVDRKILPSSLTNQKVYAEASKFAGNNDTYDKFSKSVADQKLNKKVATGVTPQQKALPGLDKPRFLIMSLFQATQGKIILDQNQQAVFEIGDKYIVAFCTKAIEEGPAPLADAANDIRYTLVKDKKAEILASTLKESAEKEKTLEGVSSALGLSIQEASQVNFRSYSVPGAGIEPALIAAATIAEQAKIAGPVKGNNGVFLLTVNNSVTANNEDIKLLKERLSATFQMRGSYEAYDALRKSSNIIDKRYKFY